jgi:hypothetical protein
MTSLHDAFTAAIDLLDPPFRAEHARLWVNQHTTAIAYRLAEWHANGVPTERPRPHFSAECTPPYAEAFEPFRTALRNPTPQALAEAIQTAGCGNLLVLLGQRRTPATLIDARGIPPTLGVLTAAASVRHHPDEELTVAARALAKHAHRSRDHQAWGKPSGPAAGQNEYASMVVLSILVERTWWNVFGHFQHDTVYEARWDSGHGARWGHDGTTFIGFLEPFDESKCPSLAPEDPSNGSRPVS